MTTRHQYIEMLKNKLDEWDVEIDKFEESARKASADFKFELDDQLASLRLQRENAKLRLGEILDASEDAWVDIKQGADEAWSSLRQAIEKARSHF